MRMIVAVDEDDAIGWNDGRLPWRSQADMKHFKELTTTGSCPSIIMGRKTYDSIGRPLPGRTSYVMTSAVIEQAPAEQLVFVNSLDEARDLIASKTDELPWIIGGATLYDMVLEQGLITELHITQVHRSRLETLASPIRSAHLIPDVRLRHKLYAHGLFIQAEASKGRIWKVDSIRSPTVLSPDPGITFVKLVRS